MVTADRRCSLSCGLTGRRGAVLFTGGRSWGCAQHRREQETEDAAHAARRAESADIAARKAAAADWRQQCATEWRRVALATAARNAAVSAVDCGCDYCDLVGDCPDRIRLKADTASAFDVAAILPPAPPHYSVATGY